VKTSVAQSFLDYVVAAVGFAFVDFGGSAFDSVTVVAGSAFVAVDFASDAVGFAFAVGFGSAAAGSEFAAAGSAFVVDFESVGFVIFGCVATGVAASRSGFAVGRFHDTARCYSRPDTRYNLVKLADRCSPAGTQARRFPNAAR
jgi:hypothetical protein